VSETAVSPSGTAVAIACEHIAKRFGHVQALRDANLVVHSGEVVALFGDNGAGKSTLLRTLLGIHHPDEGKILVGGEPANFHSVRDAQAHGIECVYQDLALAPDLSVVDNIFVGHELLASRLRKHLGILDRAEMERRADERLNELSIQLPSLEVAVRDLSGGQRQAAAIARAIMWARTAILLDEPTAALGARQSEIVGHVIREIAANGLGVLLVSHDLPRALKIADRAVILVRGATVLEAPASELTVPDVVAAMVGYGIEEPEDS
jgi:simple sugar transport system ATP-binding protein